MEGTKLVFFFFFWHTTGTFNFILIPHGVNYKSRKPRRLILYFSLVFYFSFQTAWTHRFSWFRCAIDILKYSAGQFIGIFNYLNLVFLHLQNIVSQIMFVGELFSLEYKVHYN
jgi:hypothetical protein